MYLPAVLTQAAGRFGGVNVLACVGTGLRTLHTLYAPGRACEQGPGRFGHVNVVGAGGLGGPAGRVQSVTAMAGSSRRMNGMRTLTSVISTVRSPGSGGRTSWSQSWCVCPGLGGPSGRRGSASHARACPACACVSRARACPRYLSGSRRTALPHLCTKGWGLGLGFALVTPDRPQPCVHK